MCTSPLKGFKLGVNPENGKNILKVCSYNIDHLYFDGSKYLKIDCPAPAEPSPNVITDFIELPCGQCVECRLQRSREWANRCLLEMKYHPQSLFVTLTYDNDHLPKSEIITDDGEIIVHATLVKDHMSKFMKALRQEYAKMHDNKLRFFGCGEYGSETFRPHYHMIIFGLLLDDLVYHHKNFQGDDFFTSETVSKCWSDGDGHSRGFCVISDVTWEACAYTARYIMKKHLGKESSFYEEKNIVPEFVNMSRRPGIARQYFDEHPEIFDSDFISIETKSGGRDIFPPKYYERLYEELDPEDAALRKERKQQFMNEKKEMILAKTDLNYVDYLKKKEYNLNKKINALPRKEI